MSIDAMKQALEFIKATNKSSSFWLVPESNLNKTVTALRLAIEQAEKQEPVAWLYRDAWGTLKLSEIMPPPVGSFPVYTAPPNRQPLPSHEIVMMYEESPTSDSDMIAFARAVERKHGTGGGE